MALRVSLRRVSESEGPYIDVATSSPSFPCSIFGINMVSSPSFPMVFLIDDLLRPSNIDDPAKLSRKTSIIL